MLLGLHLDKETTIAATIQKAVDARMGVVSIMVGNADPKDLAPHPSDIPLVVHANYRMNPANPLKMIHAKMQLQHEIACAEALGASCLVIHPGSAVNVTVEAGMRNLASVLDELEGTIPIAIETMAGKGNELGRSFEQLRYIISNTLYINTGVCFDTCHMHDAGMNVNDAEGLVREMRRFFNISEILCVHLNNSKNIQGSYKDRHALIRGEGFIKLDSLKRLAGNDDLMFVPGIVETFASFEEGLLDIKALQD